MQQPGNDNTGFHEEQQFRQPWLWLLLLATTFTIGGIFIYGMYIQLYLGLPWGDSPMSDTMLVIVSTLSISLTAGLTLLFLKLKLITEVNAAGIHVRFYPLTRKTIRFEDITSCKARSYSPIREYGGWGIRIGRNGKAYNVYGNTGVQLEFADALPLLIGSQRAEDLADIINRHIQNSLPD
jgi:hypothetical protein